MNISKLLLNTFVLPAFGCFLRAESSAALGAAGTAANTGATLGNEATSELGELSPFYQREMHAEHAYDPTGINEMLTAAGASTGATTGAEVNGLKRQAAISGNASGQSKALADAYRDRMKADAGVSEGIAAEDVKGAAGLRQAGAAGEAGLYGENLKGQLAAMGQESSDINAATNASQTGWLQQGEGLLKTGAGVASQFPLPS